MLVSMPLSSKKAGRACMREQLFAHMEAKPFDLKFNAT